MVGQVLPDRTAQRARPGPVQDDRLVQPGQQRLIQVGGELLERGLHPLPPEVQAWRDAAGRAALQLGHLLVAG
jgi:hypothetical protein